MRKKLHETKKFLCLLLATALTLTLVSACTTQDPSHEEITPEQSSAEESTLEETTDKEESTTEEESSSEEETTAPEKEPETYIPLVFEGEMKVCVVYPASCKDYEKAAAEELVRFIEERSGMRPALRTDAQEDTELLEILVGDTVRTEASMRSAALTNGKYAVQLTDTQKLIVNGGLLESLNYAVDEIKRGIERWGMQTEGSMLLPDTALNLTYVAPISEFMFTFGTATLQQVIGNGGQSYLLYFENAKAYDFSWYYNHLIENGFQGVEEPRIMLDSPTNFYAMCSDGNVMATIVLTEHNEQARVFVEKTEDNGYYSYVNDNTEKVCEPLFIQIGTGQLHGQCEIFRFANGDFFIVDGGLNDASPAYADVQNCQRIVEVLKTYAPDPDNICIVGWLLTHVHEDHTGAFSYFMENYAKDPSIRVENILFNNYSDVVVQEKASDATWVVPLIHRVEARIQAYADATGASIHKTHPGQVFYFGDAKLEIIYTHELRICSSTLTSINGLSIVSRFTVEGQTFLITGDTTTKSNQVMEAMYGDLLQSDFYQTPHHGYGGNTNTLAERVDPKWVLWPCNETRYEEVKPKTHNAYLFNSSKNRVEGHFLADFQTHVFNLPFNGSNYTVSQNEKIG